MIEARFLIPGDLATPTGGYVYARRLLRELPAHGVAIEGVMLPRTFPHPPAADLTVTAAVLSATPPEAVLLVDGLAYGALPPSIIAAADTRPIVALVHHPLGYEAGLTRRRAADLVASERAALALADRIVVTSRFTRGLLIDAFAIMAEHIVVAEPGTEQASRAAGSGSTCVSLIAVGAVTPRKGYLDLVAALVPLADLDWTLTIAGTLDRDHGHVATLGAAIESAGLASRITLAGPVTADRLAALYARADCAVSSSHFEGYGMALAEALARGLPIVATTGGAAGETVPNGAGLKVPPGDATALSAALRSMIADPAGRHAAADRSWAAAKALPRWSDTAGIVARALKETRA